MKKLLFILGFGLIIGMVHLNKAEAQVHVNINIDVHPAWGPSGYNYAEYYYIPEINIYYDVIRQLYIYPNGRRWISTMYLPVDYWYYDFYSLYKVVLNGIVRPWTYNRNHYHLYSGYCYNYHQMPIYYMREPHYRIARQNFHGWVEPRYMPHNNGRPSHREYANNTYNGRISNEMRSSHAPARRETYNNRSTTTNRNTSPSVNNRNASTSRNTNPTVNNRSTTTNRNSNASVGNNNSTNRNTNPTVNNRSTTTNRHSNASVSKSSPQRNESSSNTGNGTRSSNSSTRRSSR